MISRASPEVRLPAFVIRRQRICTACITREQIHSVGPDNSATLLANRFFPFPFPQQRSGRLVLSADWCWALALCDATAAKSVTGPCVTTRKRRSFILIIIYGCDRSECGTMWERSTHTHMTITNSACKRTESPHCDMMLLNQRRCLIASQLMRNDFVAPFEKRNKKTSWTSSIRGSSFQPWQSNPPSSPGLPLRLLACTWSSALPRPQ